MKSFNSYMRFNKFSSVCLVLYGVLLVIPTYKGFLNELIEEKKERKERTKKTYLQQSKNLNIIVKKMVIMQLNSGCIRKFVIFTICCVQTDFVHRQKYRISRLIFRKYFHGSSLQSEQRDFKKLIFLKIFCQCVFFLSCYTTFKSTSINSVFLFYQNSFCKTTIRNICFQ